MNRITDPITINSSGQSVVDLQQALDALLARGAFPELEGPNRTKISEMIIVERTREVYGDATTKLVQYFQKRRDLQASGETYRSTAEALNHDLESLGLLGEGVGLQPFVVSGRARFSDFV